MPFEEIIASGNKKEINSKTPDEHKADTGVALCIKSKRRKKPASLKRKNQFTIKEEFKKGKEDLLMDENSALIMTRKQIYDVIWEMSVSGMSKKYNIPYTLLLKQIKEADIPVPQSSYWMKLLYNKPVEKEVLAGDLNETVRLGTVSSSDIVPNDQSSCGERNTIQQVELNKEFSEIDLLVDAEKTSKLYEAIYERENLYNAIWDSQILEVSKKNKISEDAIFKLCKALNVPMPSKKYWGRLHSGESVSKTPLPEDLRQNNEKNCTVNDYKNALSFLDYEDQMLVYAVAEQIQVPPDHEKMHSIIIEHRKAVSQWTSQLSKRENNRWSQPNVRPAPLFADSVAKDSWARVFHIFDALIKAMEPLGCSLTNEFIFTINGEIVPIAVTEAKDKIKHIPTKDENMQLLKYEEDRRRFSWTSKPNIRKYDHPYNGRISLIVNNSRIFRDCKSYKLEDKLCEIMIALYAASNVVREKREEKEEAERKRQNEIRLKEEHKKQYDAEVRQIMALTNLAEDYDMACKIRRYISAIESSKSLNDETKEWINWAKAKADWYDPITAKEDPLLGKRAHEDDPEKKQLKSSKYGWW